MSVPEADVRAEVDRILASKGFTAAGRLSRLLRYVVEKTLAGEADRLKEYAVGIEVFDRNASYDPRLDAIVRVEAGRLRSRLDEYYNGEGAASPIRISLPRGGYVAQFNRVDAPEPPATVPVQLPVEARQAWAAWPLTTSLIVVVAAMVLWLGGWKRTPAQGDNADVAVLPFSSSADDATVSARLAESVTTELARLQTVRVASYLSATTLGETRRPLREIASALNVNFAVEGSVEPDGAGLLVMVRLVNAETDRKIWVSDYRGPRENPRTIAERIAFDISSELIKRREP